MRKRSKYRPKGVRLDAMSWVLEGMRKVPETGDANTTLRLRNHQALEAILKGKATKGDVDVLIAAFNMAEAFPAVRPTLGADWKPEIRQGQDALLAMSRRGVQTGRFVFTGPEMLAVRQTMEIHDAQLDDATVREMEQALEIVSEFLRTKRAVRIAEGVMA